MSINPLGGAGGGFDPERRKTPEERAEEAAGHLRERVRRQQREFQRRLLNAADAPRPRPRSTDPDVGRNLDLDA